MTKKMLILLGLLCLIGIASAMGSANYGLNWNIMEGGGGATSSSSYSMQSTIGQITGSSTSTNYKLEGDLFTSVTAPPLASFTVNQTSGKSPLVIQFNDTSTNSPTGWLWQWGDSTANTTGSQNATHTFTVPGIYQINLTASNADGSNLSANTAITVNPLTPPVASFTENQTSGKPPLMIQFNDTSTNSPTGWLWQWGDGTGNTTTENTTHTFTVVGTYQVNLTADNADGSNLSANAAITVNPPILPGSITNLRNTTYAPNYINWTWRDPTDTNFAKVMIVINGVWQTNVAKGVMYYNATGLLPSTSYTIATHTVDISGNINSTWVNCTAWTNVAQNYTTTTLTSSRNPSATGLSVTFTATVSVIPPGGGIPTGSVQFKDGSNNLGPIRTLRGGNATFTTSSLPKGSHSIAAVYTPNTNKFVTSKSPILTQLINPPPEIFLVIPMIEKRGASPTIQIFGNYFQPKVLVSIERGSTTYPCRINGVTPTKITCTATLPTTSDKTALGIWNIVVMNPDGGTVSKPFIII